MSRSSLVLAGVLAVSTDRTGVYAVEQAEAGKAIYAQKCASCHRDSLAGGVNESPPLKGAQFMAAWQGMPLRSLYSRILSTMPKSDPGSLSEAETLNLLAYLLQENGFPPSTERSLKAQSLAAAIPGAR